MSSILDWSKTNTPHTESYKFNIKIYAMWSHHAEVHLNYILIGCCMKVYINILYICSVITTVQNTDQADIMLIRSNCEIGENRIENINAICMYHQNIVDQKLRRLAREDQYYVILSKRFEFFNMKSIKN